MRGEATPRPVLRRHQRVWLSNAVSLTDLQGCDQHERVVLEGHARRGHPFVARRVMHGEPPDQLALALCLPPGSAQRSLAFSVAPAAVVRIAPAIKLSELLQCDDLVPPSWRDGLTRLDDAIASTGVILRAYGSLAWQRATGTVYLRDGSDVDLLVCPVSEAQARACLAILGAWSAFPDVRLDGEMEFPDGRAVAWRELLSSPPQVIAKSVAAVALEPSAALWGDQRWERAS